MKYRLTCLTPTLIGDGQKLAPIDYMVWRDHVNVLDQRRIFRLLSKGPRLDGYLLQLKKSEKLDFASWGGFAQNFAGRRIPFEHPSSVPVWERAHAENLFIPTFANATSGGAYVPATAIKGALRTGAVADRWNENTMRELAARLEQERMPRNPAAKIDDVVRVRRVGAGDSDAVGHSQMKVYLLRVASLIARGSERFELGWKSTGRTVDARRMDDSTPLFAEMAIPGASFEGVWRERSEGDRHKLFVAANRYAAGLLARHQHYAAITGLGKLGETLSRLESRVAELAQPGNSPRACVLSIGWGGGLLGKAGVLETQDESYRQILKNTPFYQRAIQTGLPFPKTRKVVFEGAQPASLPGWVLLEVS
jgi:CRISPR-associated protein Csm5